MYGSPFDGGTGINKNIRAKLGGIIFLERAEENSIEVLDKNSIFSRIYKNTIKFSLDDEYAGYMLNTADKLIKENYFYLLKCNMNIESAEICEKFLLTGDSYGKAEKILDSETNKWIVKKAKPQIFGIIIMSVIFGGMAYLGVAVATLSRGIVDSAVNSDVGGIVYFAIILISLTIAQLVIRIISKVLTFNVSSKLEISIKQDIFDNIIRKNIMRFQAYTPANYLTE